MPDGTPTARELARRSQAAVTAMDRDGWLSLFADDAVVQDPIGPSPFDPEGTGHCGPAAIAAFYDNVIAPSERITFEIERSYLCGDEVADVGVIRTVLAGGRQVAVVRGVYTYRSNGEGKLAALRAFWEFDTVELTAAAPRTGMVPRPSTRKDLAELPAP
jgi:steroid delta-isomerase